MRRTLHGRNIMRVAGKIVVVTGGARGIGEAMVRSFAKEGAAAIAVADMDLAAAGDLCRELTAGGVKATPFQVDISDEQQIKTLIDTVERDLGPIDLFCSNAGTGSGKGLDATDADLTRNWTLNVVSHVYAARHLVPRMVARGGGYLLNTCSGAGLLANADMPYMVTKHAAVAFADWLAIRYRAEGIKVSALCPRGVKTTMLTQALAAGIPAAKAVMAGGDVLEPAAVADAVVKGLEAETFLILPHPDVGQAIVRKASERDAWQGDIAKLFAGATA